MALVLVFINILLLCFLRFGSKNNIVMEAAFTQTTGSEDNRSEIL